MADPYFSFVASAYAVSALALAGLGLWTWADARRTARALERLQQRARAPQDRP